MVPGWDVPIDSGPIMVLRSGSAAVLVLASLELDVRDEGVGRDAAQAADGDGLDLLGCEEFVEQAAADAEALGVARVTSPDADARGRRPYVRARLRRGSTRTDSARGIGGAELEDVALRIVPVADPGAPPDPLPVRTVDDTAGSGCGVPSRRQVGHRKHRLHLCPPGGCAGSPAPGTGPGAGSSCPSPVSLSLHA